MSEVHPRREFISTIVRVAGGAGLIGASLWSIEAMRDGRLDAPSAARGRFGLLRPPGALAEDEFLARCVRCTRCADACRSGAIRLFAPGEGELSGTPYILPDVVGCHLCLSCGEACPVAALVPLEERTDVRMGYALVDERLCVSHNGTGVCGACHTICPLKNRAITQNWRNAPEVHEDACVGCGLCEEACIVEGEKAIRVVARDVPRPRVAAEGSP